MSHAQTAALPANVPASAVVRRPQSLLKSYMALGKARLSAMVVVTTALGYIVAARQNAEFHMSVLLWTCAGTLLAAMGAAAFNQVIERRRDAQMKRTANRPLPGHHLSPTHAAFFALLVSIAGIAILCPTSNGLTAILAFANILLYAAVYTPLKTVSTANTLVGAIVGAIPPMIGWAAATDSLSPGAFVLGGILFVWQIPHFLALAWMYREDYARGGFKMVSTTEPTGRLTTSLCVLYSLALVPTALGMVFFRHAGLPFAIVSTLLGMGLVYLSIQFARTRTNAAARKLFLATLIYLPLLSLTLVLDARSWRDDFEIAPAGYYLPSNEPFTDPDAPRPAPAPAPTPPAPESAR